MYCITIQYVVQTCLLLANWTKQTTHEIMHILSVFLLTMCWWFIYIKLFTVTADVTQASTPTAALAETRSATKFPLHCWCYHCGIFSTWRFWNLENMIDFKLSVDMHVAVACICATLKEATIRCHHKSNPNTVYMRMKHTKSHIGAKLVQNKTYYKDRRKPFQAYPLYFFNREPPAKISWVWLGIIPSYMYVTQRSILYNNYNILSVTCLTFIYLLYKLTFRNYNMWHSAPTMWWRTAY